MLLGCAWSAFLFAAFVAFDAPAGAGEEPIIAIATMGSGFAVAISKSAVYGIQTREAAAAFRGNRSPDLASLTSCCS
jgi:hypothetical protein